ncbi:AAA family ATPase [Pseudactinotalea sp. HY158]|nr:AAA family ATPase [Pseudactinotalea sp. HY158]
MSAAPETIASMSVPPPSPPSADELLAALDADQRAVASQLTGPLCVLAGAGTGKTRAITYRIAHGVAAGRYRPNQVLAVTFTARAAAELRSRLRGLGVPGVQARTFHAAALRQLSYFWPKVVGGPLPRLVEHKATLISEAGGRLGMKVDRLTIRDLAGEIEWAKVSMLGPDDYAAAATRSGRGGVAGFDPTTIARLLSVYEDVKTERNVIDFEDVLLLTVGILAEHEDVAAQVRSQYRHFVVDEYQDVSPLQHQLLGLWLGGREEVCVVGDVSQTIYSFTGASPRYLTEFTRTYPDAHVVRLVRDYRSTPQVVGVANQVLAAAGHHRAAGAVELVAQREPGPPAAYTSYDDDAAEARGVASRIGRLRAAGVPLAEIAVLYRTNGQSEAIEQALSEAGIGYQVHGGQRFFSRREVTEAIVLLRGAVRATTELSLPQHVRDVLTGAGWTPEPPPNRGSLRDRWESLNALATLADDLFQARGVDMAGYVDELLERANAQHAPTVQGVTLASLHASKGLEWDAVFLVGVTDGLLPISFADTPAAIEEERRLLYVGVTRAREHLEFSYSRSRSNGGRGTRKRSRFLDGIWPAEQRRARATTRRRREIEQDEDIDEELLARLREWRASVASRLDKPAFTVLHDTTLAAIASAQPKELRQLAILRGIGPTKLDAYGPQILAVVRGEDPLRG